MGNVSFVCTCPGSAWISIGIATSGKMFGPNTGVCIVGQPNDVSVDAFWAGQGGPVQMTYMRGYGVTQFDKVNLPRDNLPPPQVSFNPATATTTLTFTRAFDDRPGRGGVTWGDPRDIPFTLATPLTWIYGIGYDFGLWTDGHPLRGADTIALGTCTRAGSCGGNGNCTPSALASAVVPGGKCACDLGGGMTPPRTAKAACPGMVSLSGVGAPLLAASR